VRGIAIPLAVLACLQGMITLPATVECPRMAAAVLVGFAVYGLVSGILDYGDSRITK
jgi:hypothetical protein